MMAAFTLVSLLALFGAFGLFVFVVCRAERDYGDGMCAPSRRANITASQPQAQRRVVVQLGPPAGWHEPAIVPARAPARAVVVEDDTPMPPPRRVVYAQLQPEPAVQDLAPIAVPSWPTRQTVEQPEPAQVTVNRMAARFASLELRGGK